MATERLSMRKIREILRQKWELLRSHREVARSAGTSAGAVASVLERAVSAGLDWNAVKSLGDTELERKLYPAAMAAASRAIPDFAWIHLERRKPGVTLELLQLEYLEQHSGGYGYSQYCEYYRRWLKKRQLTMRQEHRAGEKLFVDYSGKKPSIVDPSTGECIEVELFVAVLGASNYTFAEASLSQRGPDWIASHVRAFAYFGGVTALIVPDQLKSGVIRACRYEPTIQRTYEEMAEHYGTSVLPARAGHPRDKAKVEVGVQVVQRWILARLRNQTFFSLEELNQRISELLEELNDRKMRIYGTTRRDLFSRLDRPALKPLPQERFVYGEWKTVRVNIDYHVEIDRHYYSVPYSLVHEQVDSRITATSIEIFQGQKRVASHLRSYSRGRHTTISAHMPQSHQKQMEWTPSRILSWAERIGPHTARLTESILTDRPHPEHGYRSCLGILRLAKRYGEARLEIACDRAFSLGVRSFRHVDSILKNGLDRIASQEQAENTSSDLNASHENVRGPDYYH